MEGRTRQADACRWKLSSSRSKLCGARVCLGLRRRPCLLRVSDQLLRGCASCLSEGPSASSARLFWKYHPVGLGMPAGNPPFFREEGFQMLRLLKLSHQLC